MVRRIPVLFGCLALAVAHAAPAWGHVKVEPKEAARGSVTTFTFMVPNESDTAGTIKVEVFFPEEARFTTVTPQPVAGWTPSTTAASAAWSGGPVTGEDKVAFQLTVGPLPSSDADRIVFKTLQTYDNGDVVRWIDVAEARSVELEHPAPFVELTGPVVTPTTTTTPPDPTTTAAAPVDVDDGGLDPTTVLLGFAAVLVVTAVAVVALRRRSP